MQKTRTHFYDILAAKTLLVAAVFNVLMYEICYEMIIMNI